MQWNWLTLLLPLFAGMANAAQTLNVAAASDLSYCMEKINSSFQHSLGQEDRIKVSLGSSGNFFAQIQAGAPFEVFLSADMSYPEKLALAGMADKASLTPYALGRLALWVLDKNLDPAKGLLLLTDKRVQRVALANPDHAPYGRVAHDALQRAGLWETLRPKLVMGENIAQTAQFVQSGNAQAALVAASLLASPQLAGMGRYWVLPLDAHARLLQGGVVTAKGRSNPLAWRYLEFLRSPEGHQILNACGFMPPDGGAR